MAITESLLRFLLKSTELPSVAKRGGSLLCLGVQDVHMTHDEVARVLREQALPVHDIAPGERRFTASQMVPREWNYAHVADLFRMIGFARTETMDFSAAEGADHIQNLNDPVPLPSSIGTTCCSTWA